MNEKEGRKRKTIFPPSFPLTNLKAEILNKWYTIYHLSVRFSSRSFFFVKNPFRIFHILCFVLFLNSVLFSKKTHINHAMQTLGCLMPFFCSTWTPLNVVIQRLGIVLWGCAMSTFSMLRSRGVGLISFFPFSTLEIKWELPRFFGFFSFLSYFHSLFLLNWCNTILCWLVFAFWFGFGFSIRIVRDN